MNFVDARTQWFDRVVQDAIAGGLIKQVVVLGAGFDTRAYRCGDWCGNGRLLCKPQLLQQAPAV
jgi:O-methyltransferase involved in polyketide biosynthesis